MLLYIEVSVIQWLITRPVLSLLGFDVLCYSDMEKSVSKLCKVRLAHCEIGTIVFAYA